MAQRTKKSPTPSTAKKTGAELPKGSPEGTRASLPLGVLRRPRSVADVDLGVPAKAVARLHTVDLLDHGFFLDAIPDAMSAAEGRVLILGESSTAAAAAVGAFLVDVLADTSAEEIVRRGGSAPAFARIAREPETHPAGFRQVDAALEALDRLPEEVGR